MDGGYEDLMAGMLASKGLQAESEFGKRTRVREGGSASWTPEDQGATDPGGGGPYPIKKRAPPWQMPRVDGGNSQWRVDGQEFPALGTQKTASKVIGSADPGDTGRGRQRDGHPIPIPRVVDRGMRPAKNIRSVRKGDRDVQTRGVRSTLTLPLCPLAKTFTPRPTPDKYQNQRQYTDIDLHRSPAMTGVSGPDSFCDNIEDKNATIGLAKPIEIEQPVAMAEVAEPRGPARAGAGGPVVTEIRMTTATDRTGAPITETEISQRSDVSELNQIAHDTVEMTTSDQLECLSVKGDSVLCGDTTGNSDDKNDGHFVDPDGIRRMSDTEQMLIHSGCSSDGNMETIQTGIMADPEEGDAIMVGVVGSAAPWYLTGWTNDVEVEFMIDTGCQVTILATSVFKKMCDIHPEVGIGLVPCTQRLVSADSSPLTAIGRINLNVVFPGLRLRSVVCGFPE